MGVVLSGFSATSQADQIVVAGHNERGVTLVDFAEGQVLFREAGGRLRRADVSLVEFLFLDHGRLASDFNEAERYQAQGQFNKAIVRYRRALHISEGFWSDLIVVRLFRVCGLAHRIEDEARYFIRVVKSARSRPAAGRLLPDDIPSRRTASVAHALTLLDRALAARADRDSSIPLRLYRYDILRRTHDRRSSAAAKEIAAVEIPPWLRSERVYSSVEAALDQTLAEAVTPGALRDLNRAIRDCPRPSLPGFLLLKGRALLRTAQTREDIIRASWPFLRVVIHMPKDPRAAQGLYGAALALERIGRTDKAVALLEECLARPGLPEETSRRAQEALARLRKGKLPSRS